MNDSFEISDQFVMQLARERGLDDGVPIRGHVKLELIDGNGALKDLLEFENLVVTAGKNYIADALSSAPGSAAMSHMAIGTGSVAAAVTDTALGVETSRVALTSRTDSGNVVTYVGTWAAGVGTSAVLREAGIFNAATAGTMLARVVYANIDKQAGDTLTITWTVTIG